MSASPALTERGRPGGRQQVRLGSAFRGGEARGWELLEEHRGVDLVLAGEVTLVTDAGDEVLRAGDGAGFKAGDGNGHCLQNRSGAEARVLEVGSRVKDNAAHYPDVDMVAPAGGQPAMYTRRDGTPYQDLRRRGPED